MKKKQINETFKKILFLLLLFSIFISFPGCDRCDCDLDDNKPLPPSIQAIKDDCDFQVTITWNNVPDVSYYNLYYSDNEELTKENAIKMSNVTSPYIHQNLSINGHCYYKYCYIVTCVKGECESLSSNHVCVDFQPEWNSMEWDNDVWSD